MVGSGIMPITTQIEAVAMQLVLCSQLQSNTTPCGMGTSVQATAEHFAHHLDMRCGAPCGHWPRVLSP